jgi:hypothetical protein
MPELIREFVGLTRICGWHGGYRGVALKPKLTFGVDHQCNAGRFASRLLSKQSTG